MDHSCVLILHFKMEPYCCRKTLKLSIIRKGATFCKLVRNPTTELTCDQPRLCA